MSETLFLKEKSFSFFLTYKKNRSDFSTTKKSFFLKKILQNIFEFLSLKTIFLNTTKQIWYFDKSKPTFLTNQNRSDFFKKNKRRDFINKFM